MSSEDGSMPVHPHRRNRVCRPHFTAGMGIACVGLFSIFIQKKTGILRNMAITGAGAKRAAHQKLTYQPAALSDHLTSDLQQLKTAASPEDGHLELLYLRFAVANLRIAIQIPYIPVNFINHLLFHN